MLKYYSIYIHTYIYKVFCICMYFIVHTISLAVYKNISVYASYAYWCIMHVLSVQPVRSCRTHNYRYFILEGVVYSHATWVEGKTTYPATKYQPNWNASSLRNCHTYLYAGHLSNSAWYVSVVWLRGSLKVDKFGQSLCRHDRTLHSEGCSSNVSVSTWLHRKV